MVAVNKKKLYTPRGKSTEDQGVCGFLVGTVPEQMQGLFRLSEAAVKRNFELVIAPPKCPSRQIDADNAGVGCCQLAPQPQSSATTCSNFKHSVGTQLPDHRRQAF